MCLGWISEPTVTFALYIINRLVFITEAESVYSAVRTESLYKTRTSLVLERFSLLRGVSLGTKEHISSSTGETEKYECQNNDTIYILHIR